MLQQQSSNAAFFLHHHFSSLNAGWLAFSGFVVPYLKQSCWFLKIRIFLKNLHQGSREPYNQPSHHHPYAGGGGGEEEEDEQQHPQHQHHQHTANSSSRRRAAPQFFAVYISYSCCYSCVGPSFPVGIV